MKTFSKRFIVITGIAVLLNLLHGIEVSSTNFITLYPNAYPYTKLFNTIPEAVYYVQHGFLYIMFASFFFFVAGRKWQMIPLGYFAIFLTWETHHFFRGILSFSYESGMITSGLFIPITYMYIKELVAEFRKM